MDLVLVRTPSITVLTCTITTTLIDCTVHPYVQYELYLQCYSERRVSNHPSHSNYLPINPLLFLPLPLPLTSLYSHLNPVLFLRTYPYPYLHRYPVLSLCPSPLLVLILILSSLFVFSLTLSSSLYCVPVGSLVGAYFIGRQLPYFGPEVYYDVLTSAGTYVRHLMGYDV
jgi:hypothetical protein